MPEHHVGAMRQHLLTAQETADSVRCESLCLLGSVLHRLLGRASRADALSV